MSTEPTKRRIPKTHSPQEISSVANKDAIATSEWASPDALAAKHPYHDGSLFLGANPLDPDDLIGVKDERHAAVIAGTRGGKGSSFIINNLCLWPGSCVVVDPKGENAAVTARRRGTGSDYCYGKGQNVYVLDPFNAVPDIPTASFNPFDALDPDALDVIDEVARLADSLVVSQSQDPFWEEAARELIKSLILHVLTSPVFAGHRNLLTVRRLIAQGDWLTAQILRDSGEEDIAPNYTLLWNGMRRNESFNGLISGAGERYGNMNAETLDSILLTANTNTEFLDSPAMAATLATSDLALSDLKTDPNGVSLFLVLPQRYMSTHYRWLRMLISLTVTEMERIPGKPANGFPILMMLDEFAGLKRMNTIETSAAQLAGFGVKLVFILQTLAQLKETYKESWETFLANTGVRLFFQVDDNFTRDYVSKQLGETEVRPITHTMGDSDTTGTSSTHGDSKSTSISRSKTRGRSKHHTELFYQTQSVSSNISRTDQEGRNWSKTENQSHTRSRSWNENLQKKALLTPDEIGRVLASRLNPDDPDYPGLMAVIISGEYPGLVRRTNYYENRFFDNLFDPHPSFSAPPTVKENEHYEGWLIAKCQAVEDLKAGRRSVSLPPPEDASLMIRLLKKARGLQ